MAVYTPLSDTQIRQLLKRHELGQLCHYSGITDGIENSNYQIETSTGNYILTIFEHYNARELTYFLELMHFLRSHGMTVPEPVAGSEQQLLSAWQTKPVVVFKQLPGKSILHPKVSHCRQIGTALALLHTAGQQFPLHRANPWGFSQVQGIGQTQLSSLTKDDALLLADELAFQYEHIDHSLCKGLIHADLFRDNALFDGQSHKEQLSGLVDFYSACHAPLLLDLAICVNDWCCTNHYALDLHKVQALLNAYQQVRPLNDNEKNSWPTILRAAALRFWLSRLTYQESRQQQLNRNSEITPDKDPDVLKYLLLKHRDNSTFNKSLIDS